MSQIEVLDKIDYITEAFRLLHRVADEGSIEELRDKLTKKYDLKSVVFQKKMKQIDKIVKQAQKDFKEDKEVIETYFRLRMEGEVELHDCCIADCVLLRNACFYEDTLEEAVERVRNMKEEQRCQAFEENLYALEEAGDEKASTPMQIIAEIMEIPDAPEVKLKLQEILLDPLEHLAIIQPILEKAIALLKKNETVLQEMAEQFRIYWVKENEKKDFVEQMEKSAGIKIGESKNGRVLIPSIIAPNIMSVSLETEPNEQWADLKEVIRLGVIFDDEMVIFRDSSDAGYQNYALQVLKLLSDKSKFDILNITKNRPYYGSELAKELNLTTATISHHVNALVGQGLLELQRKEGEKRIYYSANQDKIKEVLEYLGRTL